MSFVDLDFFENRVKRVIAERGLVPRDRTVEVVGNLRSGQFGDFAVALAAVQGEVLNAVKDSENLHLKSRYADLRAVWDACRAPLSKHQIAVVQLPEASLDGHVTVTTLLYHGPSEQFIQASLLIRQPQNTPQGVGIATTYGRRYLLASMVGVVGENEDPDAEGIIPPQTGEDTRKVNPKTGKKQEYKNIQVGDPVRKDAPPAGLSEEDELAKARGYIWQLCQKIWGAKAQEESKRLVFGDVSLKTAAMDQLLDWKKKLEAIFEGTVEN